MQKPAVFPLSARPVLPAQVTLAQAILTLAILALATLALAFASPAQAGQSVWDHNGSQMLLTSNGNQRVISYLQPRSGISARPGQVVFEGQRLGNYYQGTAYTFRNGCQPAPYQVSGQLNSQTRIVLHGSAPKRSGCQIIGYTQHSGNARLVFTYLRKIQQQDDPQEGPQAGPVERIVKTIPGGKVIFRIRDEDEPAAEPIRIDVTAQCFNGQTIKLKTNHRTCAFDGISPLPGNSGFSINQRDYDGASCSIRSAQPIETYDLCP